MLEREVALDLRTGVVAEAEVAIVDVRSAQGVAVALAWRKIGPQDLLVPIGGQLVQGDRSRLGEGAAEAEEFLESQLGVDEHRCAR